MKIILVIALGGALGSVGRYLVGRLALVLWGPDFPWGTMIVNVAGCFVMGALAGLLAHVTELSDEVRAFLLVGVLGGFTTFSAFTLDLFTLFERGQFASTALYMGGTLVLSILALVAGLFLVRTLVS